MSAAHPSPGDFLLATCQGGAEAALVARQQAVLPGLAKAAWRRGVVTFRLPAGREPSSAADLDQLVFARTLIHSCGQAVGADTATLVAALQARVGSHAWADVHVWRREPRVEGDPDRVREAIVAAFEPARRGAIPAAGTETPAGALVLDCVLDAPDRWWVGWHVADAPSTRWPGGIYPRSLPAGKVSRAWLKLDEAIAVFGIAFEPGARAVELGAAPGGACQRLLEAGLVVTGIDPALVDETVAAHPRFEQWRMRARDVKLRQLRGFDWVVADMNIDPTSTLDAIERVLSAPGRPPRGIVATLKLPNWSRAADLPGWLERFSAWGYVPRCRQLSTGGREVCVVAERAALVRRPRGVGGRSSRVSRRPGPARRRPGR
ncbi:MAG: SAM-dependent methyltransferase [Planctomycetia bacterium]